MPRESYVFDRSQMKMVPAQEFYARKFSGVKRSDLPCPMLISDTLDDVLNPADGQRYSSKSKYYAAVRAKGCEIVGNENVKAAPRPQLDDPVHDIKRAMEIHASRPTPRRRRKSHG